MSFVKSFLRERETVTNLESVGANTSTENMEATEENSEVPQKIQNSYDETDQSSVGENVSGQGSMYVDKKKQCTNHQENS